MSEEGEIDDEEEEDDGLAVRIEPRWAEEDGDGSECSECGETAWLSHFRLTYFVDDAPVAPAPWVVCASCYEAAVRLSS